MLDRFFQLSANGTTVRREILAGLTTFSSLAVALAVIPSILAPTGMDHGALVTATAISGAVMTTAFALATNYPLVLGTGAGIAGFFAANMYGTLHIPWRAGLGLIFYEGVLFLIVSATGLRRMILHAIPHELRVAIPCGIGLFLTLLGLRSGGVVQASPYTLVTLGDFSSAPCLLTFAGVILGGALIARGARGAILIAVCSVAVLGLFFHSAYGGPLITRLPSSPISWPASLRPIFFQLDLKYLFRHLSTGLTVIFALLLLDIFDTMGALLGVCARAGLLDQNGRLPKLKQAFIADACSAMAASCIGISSVTIYFESATGVEAGGRTGLTGITFSVLFLLALFLTPVIVAIPAVATAPALIIMGAFMLQGLKDLDLSDLSRTIPAFVTMIMMPFAFSIVDGIGLGLVTYSGISLCAGRGRSVPAMTYVLALLFLVRYLTK